MEYSTKDKIQYVFFEKNLIMMVLLAVKGTAKLTSKNALVYISFRKDHECDVFHGRYIAFHLKMYCISQICNKLYKLAQSPKRLEVL